jgi:hypothetical protein
MNFKDNMELQMYGMKSKAETKEMLERGFWGEFTY